MLTTLRPSVRAICSTIIVFLIALVAARWWKGGQDFSYFEVLGSKYANVATMPAPYKIFNEYGYDGQFFLKLALNPWELSEQSNGLQLDLPAYRSQRIGLPIAAWVLSGGGRPPFVPFAIVLANFLGLLGLMFALTTWVRKYRANPLLIGVGCLVGGLLLGFGRSLADPLAMGCEALALMFFLDKKDVAAVLFLIAAILTRETSILLNFSMVAALAFQMMILQKFEKRIVLYLLPVGVLVGWHIAITQHFGISPLENHPGNIGLPFVGLFSVITDLPFRPNRAETLIWCLYLSWNFLLLVNAVGAKQLRLLPHTLVQPTHREFAVTIHVVGMLLFCLCLGEKVWTDDWAFSRVLLSFNLILVLFMIIQRRTPGRLLSITTLLVAAGSALRLVLKP